MKVLIAGKTHDERVAYAKRMCRSLDDVLVVALGCIEQDDFQSLPDSEKCALCSAEISRYLGMAGRLPWSTVIMCDDADDLEFVDDKSAWWGADEYDYAFYIGDSKTPQTLGTLLKNADVAAQIVKEGLW